MEKAGAQKFPLNLGVA